LKTDQSLPNTLLPLPHRPTAANSSTGIFSNNKQICNANKPKEKMPCRIKRRSVHLKNSAEEVNEAGRVIEKEKEQRKLKCLQTN